MKKYTFTTKNVKGNEIEIEAYITKQFNLKKAKRYAKLMLGDGVFVKKHHTQE